MARLIQDTIRKALADELLFGRLVSGGHVTIDVDDEGKLLLAFEETKERVGSVGPAGAQRAPPEEWLRVAARAAGRMVALAPRPPATCTGLRERVGPDVFRPVERVPALDLAHGR
jgi:hypothetical protein